MREDLEENMEETTTTTKPATGNGMRVYFASLADYNAGRLHGVWVDVTPDVEAMQEAIDAMLKESRELVAEEWAIHDYEGFGPVGLREYESLETLARLAAGVDRHGEWFLPLYEAAADIHQAEAWAENDYAGRPTHSKNGLKSFAMSATPMCWTSCRR